MKPKYIYSELFGVNIWVYYGWKDADFRRHVKKDTGCALEPNETERGHWYLINTDKAKNLHCIWTRKKDVWTLAHECLHCVFNMLADKGIKYDDSSEELYTYYLELIMRQTLG